MFFCRFLATVFVTITSFALSTPIGWTAEPVAALDFENDIRPILNEHCVACHGGVQQAGDVSFIHRDKALAAIEPGHPDESTLVERITAESEHEIMPPPEHGAPLSQHDIDLLVEWIRQGAHWSQPWAYELPKATPIPEVSEKSWPRESLDHYVLASLDRLKITPAADAPATQWLRRATLDITGLPPTPQELTAFLEQVDAKGELAYAETVDQLLKQPSYGERWASIWLDQIRYADSAGLGLDARRDMWKYRDWVIDALNEDLPYDEFTIKQIAGDLLPEPTIDDLVATAANRLTQTNQEGGTDDEEFRIAAVLDRVSTVWQTWQGITFSCVQCHAHPYDPIEHDEFYKFAAFFNNTADSDLDEEWPTLAVPLDKKDEPRAAQLDRTIHSLQKSIWERESELVSPQAAQWQNVTELNASSDKDTKVAVEIRDGVTQFYTIDTLSQGTTITLEARVPDSLKQLTALQLTLAPRHPDSAKADSEWGFVLSHLEATLRNASGKGSPVEFKRVIGDEPHPFKDPNQSLNEKSNDGFAAYSRIHYPRTATFVLNEPLAIEPGSSIVLKLKNRVQLLGAFPLVTRRGYVALSGEPVVHQVLDDTELTQMRSELATAQSERNKIASMRLPIMRERPEHLKRPQHVFIRGLFLTKDALVEPDVPASMAPLPEGQPRNRLALAHWLVADDNPLTARVQVNRVWAHLFGAGLVVTEEDFGSSGQRPSHPELLDHLAIQFRDEYDWSMKRLIRSIVLSSTYRQNAAARNDLPDSDSQNRFLARGPRFRMPAEMVRDSALAASGLLEKQLHGAPVFPPIPEGIWKPFVGDKWDTAEQDNPNRYRRSLYTYTKRSIPYPMFAAFDAPSREFCNPRRLRSNTPLQALMTLNDTTFVECAEALAQRMTQQQEKLRDQVEFGFVSVTSRYPKPSEVNALVALHDKLIRENETHEDAMVAVASVLLNLDEIMSK